MALFLQQKTIQGIASMAAYRKEWPLLGRYRSL